MGMLDEVRAAFAEAREEWRDLIAELRSYRQLERGLHQRITGKRNPARREIRAAETAILAATESAT